MYPPHPFSMHKLLCTLTCPPFSLSIAWPDNACRCPKRNACLVHPPPILSHLRGGHPPQATTARRRRRIRSCLSGHTVIIPSNHFACLPLPSASFCLHLQLFYPLLSFPSFSFPPSPFFFSPPPHFQLLFSFLVETSSSSSLLQLLLCLNSLPSHPFSISSNPRELGAPPTSSETSTLISRNYLPPSLHPSTSPSSLGPAVNMSDNPETKPDVTPRKHKVNLK